MYSVSMKKMLFSVMAAAAFSVALGLGGGAMAKSSAKPDDNASKSAWHIPMSQADRDSLKDMRAQLRSKRESLGDVFNAAEFDEAKARSIYDEMKTLISSIAQKRFDAAVEYKKANKDWKPGEKFMGKKGKKGEMMKHMPGDAEPMPEPLAEPKAK